MTYGNPTRNFRCEDDLWERYEAATRFRGTDKSKPLHAFVVEYVEKAELEQEAQRQRKLGRRIKKATAVID
jgi:hypothetical protein